MPSLLRSLGELGWDVFCSVIRREEEDSPVSNTYPYWPDDGTKHEDIEPDDEDDDSPFPAPTGEGLPECVECGDPNFSLRGDRCICCRIWMRGAKT